jgi:hypothetical protein
MTPAQKHLHGWLCLNSGDSFDQLWTDIAKLRAAAPAMYVHLPASADLLRDELSALAAEGLARSAIQWEPDGKETQLWFFKSEKPKPEGRTLFT